MFFYSLILEMYGARGTAGCWRSSTVEQLICNQQVAGSNPIASSNNVNEDRGAGVAEWLKAADCKSVGVCLRWFEPIRLHHFLVLERDRCGSNSVVESRPSKPLVAGSSPVSRSRVSEHFVGPRSSVVEHVLGKDGVTSSSLVVGSINRLTNGRVRHLAN